MKGPRILDVAALVLLLTSEDCPLAFADVPRADVRWDAPEGHCWTTPLVSDGKASGTEGAGRLIVRNWLATRDCWASGSTPRRPGAWPTGAIGRATP